MKKIALLTGILPILVIGAGCAKKQVENKTVSTSPQQSITSTTPIIELPSTIQVNVADFVEIENKIKQNKKIVEIEATSVPAFVLPSGILKEQIWRYFKLDDIYFLIYLRRNSNFFMNMPHEAIQSGILWARKDDTKWRSFFIVKDRNEDDNDPEYVTPEDQNNLLYLWIENKNIQIIAQDVHGGGSGEGVGKILSSSDGGKTWHIDRCFNMDVDMISVPSENKKLTMPTRLQHFVYRKPDPQADWNERDFIYNSSTGQFEFFYSDQQDKTAVHVEENCQNILLP